MTQSLPSNEACTIDVKEVERFTAKFFYQHFVKDECTNDSGESIDVDIKNVSGTDGSNVPLKKVPRYIELKFIPVAVSSENVDNQVIKRDQASQLISDHFDSIVTEDQFSSNSFISINFHDGSMDDKIYEVVSGSLQQFMLNTEKNSNVSNNKLSKQFNSLLSDDVDADFLSSKFSSLTRSSGASFHSLSEGTDRIKTAEAIDAISSGRGDKVAIIERPSRGTNVSVQLNAKIINDVLKTQIDDPTSPYSSDLQDLLNSTQSTQRTAKQRNQIPSDEDYMTMIPFIDLDVQNSSTKHDESSRRVVGYVIDKFEIDQNQNTIEKERLIIENPFATRIIDSRVKYGSTYRYQIRTIVLFILPAVDADTGELAMVKALISSKPSRPEYVECTENQAPPVPNDVNFIWDYETEKLMVTWNLPTNPQRDIKQFQVFKRTSLESSYDLVKQFNFNDSDSPIEQNENPDPSVLEVTNSPRTFWIDEKFKKNSKYIYSVCSIDAHGLSSGYSAQFEVGFDIFKNKLTKSLVSHSGAPKPYPNMYVENQLFVDSIRTSRGSRMKLYFNPEYYSLVNNQKKVIKTLSTKQDGGRYLLQVLNLDNQKVENLTITIDDQTKQSKTNTKSTKVLTKNRTK